MYSRKDLEIKHSAKGNGGVLHVHCTVISVREPLLTTLKELQYNLYAGNRRVQFHKNKGAKQNQNPEASSISTKDDDTCKAIMNTAEPGTSAITEKPTTFSSQRSKLFSAMENSPISCLKNKALCLSTSII